ncbi:Cytosolic endo-beta-N-acetylglucosaminidase [Gracilariopsis chorda]|uniref:Cytosolic endo-beta-N-acetylglucosaminidase n=1 Tax=Gracilariopsis chorda TaxID=448386 RepID=A0A2V3J4F7_9FLOR|nr:Cytosolic endo-beta-N-acetylglucosaminidase [Gracilariopsis chorda]|eukprot:PXF49193.1 Cytosolic endo-beta-N-acetylglucosaminidase [Gracilariopsis chorda]
MLRELSLKAKRRVRSNPSVPPTPTPPTHHQSSTSSGSSSDDPLPANKPHGRLSRGLSAFPRRLSRVPSLSRSSSFARRRESSTTLRDRSPPREKHSVPPSPRVFDRRPGVTTPLVDVDALLKWRPTGLDARCVSSVPLPNAFAQRYVRGGVAHSASIPASRGSSSALRRLQPARLLLCHDFRDSYHPWEANADGIQGDQCQLQTYWRFNHWAYVDVFVYFSHYCVTIPPLGFIHAAHRHGTLILGTLIFEWQRGEKELASILQSFKTRAHAARQLASIANFYGFDGWLVNVEASLKGGSSAASDLAAFVADLTRAVRKIVGPVSEVIWFDSVTRDGSLSWQNELNAENEQFFKAAGSLFTNYCWDRNAPVRSAVKAGTRRTDVWTGIDVHGRKTFGGGGFHTHLALRAIKQGGTSAAIFAPAWTVEKCPPNVQDPRELEDRFWTGPAGRFGRECVAQYFRERAVLMQLPFETCFDPGWGPRIMKNGVVKSDQPYFNMAQQSIQPSFMREVIVGGDVTAAKLDLSHDCAYNGSASIKTEFSFSESSMLTGSFSILRLFVANLLIPVRPSRFSSTVTVSVQYTFCAQAEDPAAASSAFGLVLLFASPPHAVLLVGPKAGWLTRCPPRLQIHGRFVDVTIVQSSSEVRAVGAPDPTDGFTEWLTRSFELDPTLTAGQRLAEILIITGGPPSQSVSVARSPLMSPSASRITSRVGSRFASRRNSPPNERASKPIDQNGDTFGAGLLSKYRDSFGVRKTLTHPTHEMPGVHVRLRDEPAETVSNPRFAARFQQTSYATNFAVDGNVDFSTLDNDGMMSGASSRPLSRFSSRFATPAGSRPLSRFGSRSTSRAGSLTASLAASRNASVANSLASSRQGSRFVSPSRTPAVGEGAPPVEAEAVAKLLGSRTRNGRSRSTMSEAQELSVRSSAVISDLKSALMKAAGNMAGESEGAGEKRTAYLGALKLEARGGMDEGVSRTTELKTSGTSFRGMRT